MKQEPYFLEQRTRVQFPDFLKEKLLHNISLANVSNTTTLTICNYEKYNIPLSFRRPQTARKPPNTNKENKETNRERGAREIFSLGTD
ncbi:MAG: hypothetical protein LUE98_01325 [Tannerellaceae bacterium]|nr:hypothetical protein [Tannerellaceae bacterium]